jgi:transposase-like protein
MIDLNPPNKQHFCPRCGADAIYAYGRTGNGKQRFLCLLCNRQFVEGLKKKVVDRPVCPACQVGMHVYKHEDTTVRFRCPNYPRCRIYLRSDNLT